MVEKQSTIEHDIEELEHKLEEKKAALEHEKSAAGGEPRQGREKDILHDVIGEKIQEHVPTYSAGGLPGQSGQLPTSQAPTPLATEPPSYLGQDLKDKIRELIQVVFSKSLEEGIKEASMSGNIAVIDAFHDILVDELYNQLIEKRKLQKVE